MVQRKTVITLKRETSESFRNTPDLPHALTGYLLKVSVDVAHNIDRNIFVMQRSVDSAYASEPMDTLDSIASVGELEWLPVDQPDQYNTNFYRTDEIELMFEDAKELEDSWKKISRDVKWLAQANDYSISLKPDAMAVYPSDAIPRYYGLLTTTDPTQDDLKGMYGDDLYSATIEKTMKVEGLKYFFFAFPSALGEGKMYINGSEVDTVLTELFIENSYGLSIEYNVYMAEDQLSTGTYTFAFVPDVIRYADIRARSAGYTDVLVLAGSSQSWTDFQYPGALEEDIEFGYFIVPEGITYQCYGAFSSVFTAATGSNIIVDIVNLDGDEQGRLITIGTGSTVSNVTFNTPLNMPSGSEWKLKIIQNGSTDPGQFLNTRLLLKSIG